MERYNLLLNRTLLFYRIDVLVQFKDFLATKLKTQWHKTSSHKVLPNNDTVRVQHLVQLLWGRQSTARGPDAVHLGIFTRPATFYCHPASDLFSFFNDRYAAINRRNDSYFVAKTFFVVFAHRRSQGGARGPGPPPIKIPLTTKSYDNIAWRCLVAVFFQ